MRAIQHLRLHFENVAIDLLHLLFTDIFQIVFRQLAAGQRKRRNAVQLLHVLRFQIEVVQKPQSTLRYFNLETEDVKELDRIPAFPLTSSQLAKYDLKFIGEEQVDEIDCYIFEVHPKTLDRKHPLFDGILWVDQKYLEVVKTYGKWVTDLGPMRPGNLPFNMFETYRENVDGKYWFPNYSRAEDMYKLQDREIAVRVTIKWSEFKPYPPAEVPPPSAKP